MVVEVQSRELRRLAIRLDQLGKAGRRGMRRALSTGRRRAKTISSQEIRKAYNVKAGPVGRRIKVNQLGADAFRVSARNQPLNVDSFTGARQTKAGIAVTFQKSGPRRVLRGAFFARVSAGGGSVRRGLRRTKASEVSTGRDSKGRPKRGRLPVRGIYGPGVGQMLSNTRTIDQVRARVGRILADELLRQIRLI